jgi:hypothetical protein
MAYVKYDFYSRKFYNTSPTYQEALAEANSAGVSPAEIDQLFGELLGVARPATL